MGSDSKWSCFRTWWLGYNYTLGHGVSGPNSTRHSWEWLSRCCLGLIMGRLHKKPPQLDPAFLSSSGCVFSNNLDCSYEAHTERVNARLWEKGFSKQSCKEHSEVPDLKRRWCLSGHCSGKSDSLSLALPIAEVLYKRDSKITQSLGLSCLWMAGLFLLHLSWPFCWIGHYFYCDALEMDHGSWLFSEMNHIFSTVIYCGKSVPTLAILCEVFVMFSAPEILWSRLKNQGS